MAAEGRQGLVDVALVDDYTIAELNCSYRGESGPTDVLSFCEEEGDTEWPQLLDGDTAVLGAEKAIGEGLSVRGVTAGSGHFELRSQPHWGEIVVCPAVVARYARDDSVPFEQQLAWTLIHGTLHLLGYNHECDDGRMRRRESELLQHALCSLPEWRATVADERGDGWRT